MTEHEQFLMAAGLWRGEGCFTIEKARKRLRGGRHSSERARAYATVGMTTLDDVELIAGAFGMKVLGPYPQKTKDGREKRPRWTATITGQPAIDLMTRLAPYMSEEKAAKIEEILSTPNLSHTPRA